MFAYAAIPLTCWLCALLAIPRKPRIGNEVEELVYSRLLGRHQLLRLLALIVTAAMFLAFIVTLPAHIDPTLQAVRAAHRVCTRQSLGTPTCYQWQGNGTWMQEVWQRDGTWLVVATVAAPDAELNTTMIIRYSETGPT